MGAGVRVAPAAACCRVAQALVWARSMGSCVGILQASEMGKPVYALLGFREFGGIPLWVNMPG